MCASNGYFISQFITLIRIHLINDIGQLQKLSIKTYRQELLMINQTTMNIMPILWCKHGFLLRPRKGLLTHAKKKRHINKYQRHVERIYKNTLNLY